MKLKFICLFIALFASEGLFAQNPVPSGNNFIYGNYQLEKVTFHEPTNNSNKWIEVFEDPQPASSPDIITPPIQISGNHSTIAWNIGSPSKPVAYQSGCKGRVSIEFTSNCQPSPIYIRGEGSDGYNIEWTLATINNNGNYEITPTEFSKLFTQDKVKGYEDFTIDWYVSNSPTSSGGLSIGATKNPLYVTHKSPQNLSLSNGNPIVYHSYLYISCIAANNKVTESNIINAIYDDFEDQKVYKYGSTNEMEYWGTTTSLPLQSPPYTCFSGAALIAYNNATCGAWADLLVHLGYTHGIQNIGIVGVQWEYNEKLDTAYIPDLITDIDSFFGQEKINVYWHPNNLIWTGAGINPNPPNAMFFVKDWSYNSLNVFYGEYVLPNTVVDTLNNGNIIYGADNTGIAGQGNADPRPDFENHAIVAFMGKLYDPSYGTDNTKIETEVKFENESIYGFGVKLYYWKLINGSPNMFDIIYPVEENTSNPQLKFTY